MENTPLQKRIAKAYEAMAITKKVYPTITALAEKVGVSRKYAHYVITQYKAQNATFGLNKK